MNILMSNDDGIYSQGLRVLAKKLSKNNNILIVAPDGNRSAYSHSLTISDALKLTEENIENCKAYSLSGTPADCIKFAKLVFSDFKADIVVSGINKGHNIGSDILYSGTVSIACEAAYFGDISFAFSSYSLDGGDYEGYSDYVVKIIDKLLPLSQKGDIWNINFPKVPAKNIKGIKFSSLGRHEYIDKYVKIDDDRYILVGSPCEKTVYDENSDIALIRDDYITITPILFDRTDFKKLSDVRLKCEKLL